MSSKHFLFFLLFLGINSLIGEAFFKFWSQQRKESEANATSVVLENVADRFILFLEKPRGLGLLGTELLRNQPFESAPTDMFTNLLETSVDIYGISLVNSAGLIVGSYPLERNKLAIGKLSQNQNNLNTAYREGHRVWLSAPFELYQGKRGFALHSAIVQDSQLRGWVAPIITGEAFQGRFLLPHMLENYDVIVQDEKTKKTYFSTAILPPDANSVELSHTLYGRTIRFIGWMKEPLSSRSLPLYVRLLIAGFLSALFTWIIILYGKRREDERRLQDISSILRLTSTEAVSKLVDLQAEVSDPEAHAEISFFTNLIEQVDLLQTITREEFAKKMETIDLSATLNDLFSGYEDLILKKNLNLKQTNSQFDSRFWGNRWIIENVVFGKIIIHTLVLSALNSDIEYSFEAGLQGPRFILSFQGQEGLLLSELQSRLKVVERALELDLGRCWYSIDASANVRIEVQLTQQKI